MLLEKKIATWVPRPRGCPKSQNKDLGFRTPLSYGERGWMKTIR